jgi:hypothetical protein
MQLKLLTVDNAKTSLGESLNVLTGILYLNPAVSDKLCPYATSECKALCLVNSGMAEVFPTVNNARTRKTLAYLNDRASFIEQLKLDIRALERMAVKRSMKAAVRLNGTSDIVWERLIDFTEFPNVQFYDYTKIPIRFRKLAPNYHLTFSYSGHNLNECLSALRQGTNVAMVFAREIPSEYLGFKVIYGTVHDVRFLDGNTGKIVGLCAKGSRAKRAAKSGSAFIVR